MLCCVIQYIASGYSWPTRARKKDPTATSDRSTI